MLRPLVNMSYQLSCKFLVTLIIMIGIIEVTICQEQSHMHHAYNRSRWSSQPQRLPITNPICDNKEVLDRVSNLVALYEDQRSRLESVSQKITQFETNNLARLDSLNAGQIDFLKRLEVLESLERDVNNDLNSQRRIRDAPEQSSISDAQKLDAISTLLVSTRAALNTLQSTLDTNVSSLLQETNRLKRRLINLQSLQQKQQQTYPGVIGYLPPPQSPPSRQLVTSCNQGIPTTNGILQLRLSENSDPFYVRCDEKYMNGGWTIIQDRYTGEVNFQRDWNEYKIGFGNLASEFFIGLEKLHALTSNAVHELIIVLEDFEGTQVHARYELFAIGNESEYYALKLLGEYKGNAGDAFSYHAGSKFSTYDNDNDGCVECNCAQAHLGGWWYNWCEMSNLNGKYYKPNETVSRFTGMYWHDFHGPEISLKSSRMMIRPVVLDPESRR